MVKKEKKTSSHYVNKAELMEEILAYQKQIKENAEKDLGRPQMPDSLGVKIYMIVSGLASRPNFARYSYREDMIGDAVMAVIAAIQNFDPVKSKNPYGYFTQIAEYAFIHKIKHEKNQAIKKYKCLEHAGVHGLYDAIKSSDGDDEYGGSYSSFLKGLQLTVHDIDKHEERLKDPSGRKRKTKEPRVNTALDDFFEDVK